METVKRKIVPMSKLRNKRIDTVAHRHAESGFKNNAKLLGKAKTCWDNLYQFRVDRDRALRFTYGDQWGDMTLFNGEWMTEREAIALQGKTPLTNNLIRRLVNSVKGTYLRQIMEPFCVARDPNKRDVADMVTMALQCNWQQSVSNMQILTSNMFEEFLISGMAIARESWENVDDGRFDATTYTYNPNMIFVDGNMRDPNMRDLTMLGVIHDVTPGELRSRFRLTPSKWDDLEREFPKAYDDLNPESIELADRNKLQYADFFFAVDRSRCRIYEIWTKEVKCRYICVDPMRGEMFKVEVDNLDKTPLEIYGKTIMQENADRRQMAYEAGITDESEIPYIDYGQLENSLEGTGEYYDEYWYYQFLTPNGTIIDEGESPYKCGLPFVVMMYPFVNGEIHSFVSDVIPQQKYFNRNATLSDWVIQSSAKGVLLVDVNSLGDSTPEEVREQWSHAAGIVTYDSKKGGNAPKQAVTTSTNVGIDQAMRMQLNLFEEISGVHGASQGKDALSGQSAALYAQQTQNAGTMLLSMLDAFKNFIRNMAVKKAKMICQYYQDGRFVNIAGNYYAKTAGRFDRSRLRDFEYDISVGERQFTETARMMNNKLIIELWKAQAINVEALLTAGEFPFSEKLLKYIHEQQNQMEQQNAMGMPVAPQGNPQLMQQIGSQLPDASKAENILRNSGTLNVAA